MNLSFFLIIMKYNNETIVLYSNLGEQKYTIEEHTYNLLYDKENLSFYLLYVKVA